MSIHPKLILPKAAILEMTFNCNHQCIFCCCPWEAPENNYPIDKELTIEDWKEVIDFLCSNGIQSIVLSGGEPLTKNGLDELLSYIANKRLKKGKRLNPYIITNGALLNDSWLRLFSETQTTLALSLPGITTYEYHTKFDHVRQVLDWISRSSSLGIYTVANVTATDKNLFELYKTVSIALLHGADFILLNRFLPGGRGLNHIDELILSREKTIDAFKIVDKALFESVKYGGVGTEVPMCALSNEKFERLTISTRCAAGHELFVVDPSGRIRVCNHSPVILGCWTDLDDIMCSPYWKTFANKNYLPETCRVCKNANSCDAGCREAAHIMYGSTASPDWIMEN